MKVAFLGATRGLGRALARQMAERGDRLFLLGRDAEQLERTAADLEVRGAPKPVGTAYCDLLRPDSFGPALDLADQALGNFDTFVVTAAQYASQDRLESDATSCRELLQVDLVATIELCEEVRRRLLARGGGTLCVFSSVAADRARKPVILYGTAKAGLSYYMQGLDHKFRARGLRAILVKPGFAPTGMTAGLKPPPFAGAAEDIATTVMRAIDRGTPVVYAPPVWRVIMAVIRLLPRAVMRKIDF